MEKPIDYLKSWLMIIRQARILMDSQHLLQDDFTESKALQQWIGISYDVSDKEARPLLDLAAEAEWLQGLDDLEANNFGYLFDITRNSLLNLSTDQLKHWFTTVRKGRVTSNSTHIIHDEFSQPGILQSWVGLE